MSHICQEFHHFVHQLSRYHSTSEIESIPHNGIFLWFEKGEQGHDGDRIVGVGSHTGQNQLRSRLKEHLIIENKDRSILRKHIGRCLLSQTNDPYLKAWDIDSTSRAGKQDYGYLINPTYQAEVEKKVTEYLHNRFSYCILEVASKEERRALKSKIVSSVSLCHNCKPSLQWLGLASPSDKIRESGLWQINELYKQQLTTDELKRLVKQAHV